LDFFLNINVVYFVLVEINNFVFEGGKGADEAAENRNYLAQRMTDEINEIIRVLQLTTYDEEEWDADDLTVMKKAQGAIDSKLQAAHDWLGVGFLLVL
jgi:vinculin